MAIKKIVAKRKPIQNGQAAQNAPAAQNALAHLNVQAAPDEQNGAEKKKNWTLMVYLAGDNNLSEEMIFALKSMHAVGSTDKIQVVALYDSIGSLVPYDIPKLRAKRHKPINAVVHAQGNRIPSPVVTEDHKLKQTQEKFLRKKDEFSILTTEAVIERRRKVLVAEQEEILNDRKDLVEKNGSKGKGNEKLEKALRKESEVLDEVRAALRNANQAAGLRNIKDASLVRRLRLTGSVEENLEGFVIDSIRRYPAERYALILSGHGSGAVGDFLTSNKQFFSLSMPGLGQALRQVRDRFGNFGRPPKEPWLDILGFDSCLMSMAEVAFEVRDCVRYMVGAEGFQANTGWPYDRIINLLHDNEDLNPRSFASKIVDEHITYYDDYTAADLSVDLSVLDLKHLGKLVTDLGGNPKTRNRVKSGLSVFMTEGLKNKQIEDAILLAHWEAQGYKNEQYADLWDFCECLANRTKDIQGQIASKITKACRKVQKSIESALVLRTGYRGAAFQYSHGMSIFFPWSELKDAAEVSELDHYKLLAFAGATQWDEFVAKYFERTVRHPREPLRGQKGQLQHSFLNCRPGLFTGTPQGELGAFRTGEDTFRTGEDTFRTGEDTFRTGEDTFRTGEDTFRTGEDTFRTGEDTFRTGEDTFRTGEDTFRSSKPVSQLRIASMKNPAIEWFKLRLGQT